ncbi:hypothetical protein MPTK1_5g14370 [Marchantia polymorpha subsp. ruderalis]|uniref:Phosphoinositide phospholipase C n=2 Tax=Marchantia polymorpha TaxID=3197 RepID=A0AAF6BIB3_MARPO|nr:hypothetical protein MARPO_0032s0130 [Marchantia polymorpha]BBN11747.1 hypothetical protein Mp_5g14370 [Marchantia polymorpha subsp. ruderalis]|eukprot:PTQ41965.1 hypothetical protein MARPO_0032s0130 [Marchantia polymorpha]
MNGKVDKPVKQEFGVCGCFSRRFRSNQLMTPPDVEQVFEKYAENGVITPEKLKLFLNEEQKEENATLADAEQIVAHQLAKESHLFSKPKHGLTLDSFFQYLLDPSINGAMNTKVHHDMTLPASAYYIYTGHNSYLTGNQLSSDCSEKPIVDALRRGVRVVELDLWPSKNDTQIKVYHGRTMTAPVDFALCLEAIRDNAFVASPYAVVITYEDHLTPELQAKAAQITTDVLGKLLWRPEEDTKCAKFTQFPSPEDIKHRILISTKPPKEYIKGEKHEKLAERLASQKAEVASSKPGQTPRSFFGEPRKSSEWGPEVPGFVASEKRASLDPSDKPVSDDEDTDNDDDDDDDGDEAPDHVKNPEYKSIISIRAGKPKGATVVETLVVDEYVKRVSLSEPQLEKVAEKKPSALIKFTEKNLLRIYPYGLRFNSSNYNPHVAWSHGAQMVAFNMQGYGRPLWVVHGFFKANGGCGYVRKPKFLFPSENGGQEFDPRVAKAPVVTLKVKAILGLGWLEKFGKHHFDRFSPPDFYVKIAIAGLPADVKKCKTEPIEDEWIPRWEAEFDFPISVPELALLRVEVHEYDMTDKDDFGGQTCIPLSEIKQGLRCVPLDDKKGNTLEGVRLLMHFELEGEKFGW